MPFQAPWGWSSLVKLFPSQPLREAGLNQPLQIVCPRKESSRGELICIRQFIKRIWEITNFQNALSPSLNPVFSFWWFILELPSNLSLSTPYITSYHTNTQLGVFKHSHWKDPGLFGEMAILGQEWGNISWEQILCQKVRKCLENDRDASIRPSGHLKGFPLAIFEPQNQQWKKQIKTHCLK